MTIENLSFAYDNSMPLFTSFNFQSDEKYIFFQGRSGCGKSTLLKLITGNLDVQSGSISPDPEDMGNCLVLQEDALFPWLSGLENIRCFLPDVTIEQIEANTIYAYSESFINKKAYQLSFGQRRIIELFRAVLLSPTLLCLDEPFNYLDFNSRKLISEIIFDKDIFRDTKQIIMTTHYDADIESIKNLRFESYYFNGLTPYAELEKRK